MRLDLQFSATMRGGSANKFGGIKWDSCLIFSVKLSKDKNFKQDKLAGDIGGGATPVPIPNTVVKLSSADGT